MEKLRVIGLRYGSVTDFSHVVRSPTQISKMCYVPLTTVLRILKNFERSGFHLEQVDRKKPRTYALMEDWIKTTLLDKDLL